MKFFKKIKSDWLYMKASGYLRRHEYREAIGVYLKAIELMKDIGKKSGVCFFKIGYCYYECGQFDEAMVYFEKAYAIYSKKKHALRLRPYYYLLTHYSTLLKRKGDLELAEKIFQEAEDIKEVR